MVDEDDAWDPAESAELRALGETPPPPAALDGVIAELRRRGPLGRRAAVSRWARLAAAAAVVFGAGLWLGGQRPAPALEERPRYLLLLYDAAPSAPGEQAARVREYGAWARGLRARGALVAAEKLKEESTTLGPAAVGNDRLGGYFVIAAPSLEDALAIARECPHLRHGGRVVVRPIDPV